MGSNIVIEMTGFRHQWAGADEETGESGKPKGPYGEVYAKRRARTAETHPDWTKAHSHKDALRIMTKALIADLWSAWRAARKGVDPSVSVPPAPLPMAAE